MTYQFWFVAITHDKVDDYIRHLEKYVDPSSSYIVAKETAKGVHHETNGQHIHVAAQIDDTKYNLLHDNVHKKQLKLKCKAGGGVGKQVGRIKKNIRDETKFLSYTVKDKHIIYENIDLKTIQDYIEKSYPKDDPWEEQIINYFHKQYREPDGWTFILQGLDTSQLEDLVIEFYIHKSKSKAVPSKHFIKKLILRYLMYEQPQVTNIIKMQIKNLIL